MALEDRVAALEAAVNTIRGSAADLERPGVQLAKTALQRVGARGVVLELVPADYYHRELAERAKLLRSPSATLCKTLLMENTLVDDGDSSSVSDFAFSKYYAVVLQYESKFNQALLVRSLSELSGGKYAKSRYNFRLVSDEAAAALSPYPYNAVTPFGLKRDIPVVVSSLIAGLKPQYLWLGGGEVDVKLRITLHELTRLTHAKVLHCADPRDGDDEDDDSKVAE